ncbi:hypothetical protein KAR91_29020 [Candidatus Pacearchaeota archaeon]|nr:hypothetical protein [Candidatus Pacearchaeota archaeon]
MSVTITTSGDTSKTDLTLNIYYNNAGTITARQEDIAMTEEPAGSGEYKGEATTVEAGDIIRIEDDGEFYGDGEYRPVTNNWNGT